MHGAPVCRSSDTPVTRVDTAARKRRQSGKPGAVAMPLAWLVPDSIRREGADSIRRARAVLFSGTATALVAWYAAWNQRAQGFPRLALLCLGVGSIGALAAAAVWVTGRWRASGVALAAALFAALGSTILISGGELLTPSFLLALVPMLATLTLGVRWGIGMAAAGVTLLVVNQRLVAAGVDFPLSVPHDVAARGAQRGALIFQVLLAVVAVIVESLRSIHVREASESAARYDALGAQSHDLLFELDTSGRVRFASPRHCEALGWPADASLDADGPAFVHTDDAGRFAAVLEEALVHGAAQGEPVRLSVADGGWRWFEPSITAYTLPNQEQRLVVVVRDLTERRRLDEQLRQSQKMDAIGQLAGGVAHDFNNLLMVMGSYAEQLVRRLPAGDDRIAAEEIARAAERGELLTRQLLAVSRPSSARPRRIVVNDVVEGLRRMLARLIGEDVVMELSLDPALPAVVADPGHIEQILVNLATNARDAMPRGGTLRITTSARDGQVRLEIADTGVGMDDATRERVFEAFFTTKDRRRGTGLGLYVVYSLVGVMQGTVQVESSPNVGTTVAIQLPAVDGAAVTPVVPAALGEAEMTGGDETVLIVEDRPEVRALVRTTLEGVGYTVLEASDGVAGLDLVGRHPGAIDLVVSDVVMPRMSGPEMAEQLRRCRPGIRVLFMSGHPERARHLAGALHDATLLMKPILPSDLCRHVRAALDGVPADAGAASDELAPRL